ncbi:hypothetical protein Syun_028269 [Stephania yunnanensis]|uniref:CAND6/7 N-terminal domain-containing protein n=1 Tax=Stephania yunnanensis TaxID=152371 RepID=A0AAP0HLR8_9MAGN
MGIRSTFPCCFAVSLSTSSAEIRVSEIRSDDRSIIPFDEFGFTHNGRLELLVSHISLSNPNPDLDLSLLGFFLSTRDSWIHVLRQIQDLEITCALRSDSVHLFYSFDRLKSPNPNPNPNSFARIDACLVPVKCTQYVLDLMKIGHRNRAVRVTEKKGYEKGTTSFLDTNNLLLDPTYLLSD